MTLPVRSACVASTPSAKTAMVTPAPSPLRHAWMTCSLLSHHSDWRQATAFAGMQKPAMGADTSPITTAA